MPRDDEEPNVDYIFVTVEEFKEMERNGELLESGIFGENYYGTPKPPKDPKKLANLPPKNTSQNNYSSDASYKKEQPPSNDQTDGGLSRKRPDALSKSYHQALHVDSLGPLPGNWEIAYTEENEKYYIE